jgi:replicative DNA helicase Mcm
LAEYFLSRSFKATFIAEKVIEGLAPPEKKVTIHLRVKNLPRDSKIEIRDLRSKHLGRFIAVEGLVRKATEVRPKMVDAVFQCARCNAIIREPQDGLVFREPLECYKEQGGCLRTAASTKFKLQTEQSSYVDTQKIEIQESPEGLRGGAQPQRLVAYAEDDLTGRISPGDRIIINGSLRSVQKKSYPVKSTLFEIFLDINSIELEEHEFEEVPISPEDAEQIIELSKDPDIYRKITASISPTIYGMTVEKEALALQLFGGVSKIMPDGTHIRGDIHIFLVGDPGTAKSQLLRYISELAPRGIYASGKSSSAAGLTAAAVKDEFGEGRWTLEAGALVLADKGVACLLPDSQVIVDNKMVKISSLFDESKKKLRFSHGEKVEIVEIGSKIISFDTKSMTTNSATSTIIRRKWYEGKVLKFKMKSGFSIELTPEHLLLDGNSLKWKQACEFFTNDFVLSPQKIPEKGEDLFFLDIIPEDWIVILNKKEKEEIKSFVRKKFSTLSVFNRKYGIHRDVLSGKSQMKIGIFRRILSEFECYDNWKIRNLKYGRRMGGEKLKTCKITPELSYFFGFVYGDGHVQIDDKHSHIHIYQSQVHINQINQIKGMFAEFSYRTLGEYKRNTKSQIRGRDVKSESYIYYTGSNLLAFCYDYLTDDNLGNVLQLPDECIKAFVAGAFDADGCISIKKGKKKEKIYKTAHVEFLLSENVRENLNFMMALRRLDCYSRLIKNPKVHRIRITGRNDILRLMEQVKKYSVKIKDIPPRKTMISSTSDKLPLMPTKKICEELSRLHTPTLLKQGIWSTIHVYKNGRRQPSKEQLHKIKYRLEGVIGKELSTRIDSLTVHDYFLDEINEITEKKYQGYVYDLYVPGYHNFLSEGIIVHNCVDELDKMTPQDRSSMHEAMEQQRISIAKAGITATLQSRCAVLGAANPKYGRFDTTQYLAQQINIPVALLSRFDLIFTITDSPDSEKDLLIAEHILRSHTIGGIDRHRKETGEEIEGEEELPRYVEPYLDRELFRKYVAYAKRIFPIMTKEASTTLRDYYTSIRKQGEPEGSSVPITARQLEAFVRVSEASARVRLSDRVTEDDAQRAIRIVEYYLRKVAGEEGRFDIDIIESGTSQSQRERIRTVRTLIKNLAEGGSPVEHEDIIAEAEALGIERSKAESIIKRLHFEDGYIYEARLGSKKYRVAKVET